MARRRDRPEVLVSCALSSKDGSGTDQVLRLNFWCGPLELCKNSIYQMEKGTKNSVLDKESYVRRIRIGVPEISAQ